MKRKILQLLGTATCLLLLSNITKGQNFPANGTEAEEIAIGGPSIDYLTLEFPRPGVATCQPYTGQTRTVKGDIEKYGKALLVIIFPKDCPYCIVAANQADAVIDKYRDKLTVWYVNQRLNGEGSCGDITEMSNKYPFIKNADFQFIDIYMWNNTWGSSWHYPQQDSYWSRKSSPSVYRIFNPKTKKVTGMNYYVGQIESQIQAAIQDNYSVTNTVKASSLESYELYPNPTSGTLNLNLALNKSENLTIIISNSLGQEVLKQKLGNISSFNNNINIEQLPNAIYTISIVSEDANIITDHFIKY